jgi:hypothetical protein
MITAIKSVGQSVSIPYELVLSHDVLIKRDSFSATQPHTSHCPVSQILRQNRVLSTNNILTRCFVSGFRSPS